ncbi:hypothetical protein A2U01_0074708 [Trifolium medium]|uniref:Uncharacterized protein n=1 Tax=Trifolium medium TaxID=97028 RepID=A0A392SX77_9FABA|nr:hypothetical protein [Trifolium medium]
MSSSVAFSPCPCYGNVAFFFYEASTPICNSTPLVSRKRVMLHCIHESFRIKLDDDF